MINTCTDQDHTDRDRACQDVSQLDYQHGHLNAPTATNTEMTALIENIITTAERTIATADRIMAESKCCSYYDGLVFHKMKHDFRAAVNRALKVYPVILLKRIL